MNNVTTWRKLAASCVIAFVITLLCLPSQSAASGSSISAWLKRCGGQSPDSMRTRRVKGIFERVKNFSDARSKQSSLYILDCDGWPWAATLQDRNIILTSGAIETIYGSNDPINAKDARMAFVLGHELKHVQEDDFWHEKIRKQQFMSGKSLLNYGELTKERRRHDERRADEDGFIYASLAGFDMREILKPVRGEENFLADWAQQTGTLSGDTHFLPASRVEHLKRKFQSLDNAVEQFKSGVRLAHFGRFDEARILLEDFQNIYPSTQVYNNLGYLYLQMARREMPPELAYRYWMPMMIEIDSGIPASTSRNVAVKLPFKAREYLQNATRLLENGLASHPNKSVAINLITALMFLGEYSAAQATIETIPTWESDPQLIALDAIALVQNKRLKDPWNTYSRENFETEALKPNADDNIVYNYARLLLEQGYKQQAVNQFNRLNHRQQFLPLNYRTMICREIKASTCAPRKYASELASQWLLDITPGDDIDSPSIREILSQWNAPITDKLDGIDASIFTHSNGNSILAINGIVEVVSIKQHGYDFKDQLIADTSAPVHRLPSSYGQDSLLSFGPQWSAVINDEEVKEIWITRATTAFKTR